MADELPNRNIDLATLKALAHPLRVRILDTLGQYGPSTASALGTRLGESSGATSYHLRQLARHDLVKEMPEKGSGRERWWRRTPGSLTLGHIEYKDSPSARAATDFITRQWQETRQGQLWEFVERGMDVFDKDWIDASILSSASLRLTKEQLAEFTTAWMAFSQDFVAKHRDLDLPGSRPVQVHFNAFPLVDGDETK